MHRNRQICRKGGFEFAGDSSASPLLQKNILVKGINSFVMSAELLVNQVAEKKTFLNRDVGFVSLLF